MEKKEEPLNKIEEILKSFKESGYYNRLLTDKLLEVIQNQLLIDELVDQ